MKIRSRRLSVFAALLAASAASAVDLQSPARPAYSAAENVADRFYSLVSHPLSSWVMPSQVSDRFNDVPDDTSYSVFSARLQERQERVQRDMVQALSAGPRQNSTGARYADAELNVVTDSFADAMADRYRLRRLGTASREFVADPSAWDWRGGTSLLIFGGGYVYAKGLRTSCAAGPARINFELKSGNAFRAAAQSGSGSELAVVRLSPANSGMALKAAWGLRSDRVVNNALGVDYSRKF